MSDSAKKTEWYRTLLLCTLVAFLAISPVPSHAGAPMDKPRLEDRSVLSFQSENDLYGDSHDRWFTNGFRLSLAVPPDKRPKTLDWVADLLPSTLPADNTDFFMSIGQSMFSPADITVPDLIEDDRPYAAWLFGEVGVSGGKGNMQETLTLSIGVTGAPALGKRTQKFVHGITASPDPQGWDHQVPFEPTLQIFYERAWFYSMLRLSDAVAMDISPRVGVDLGTVFVDVNAGAVVRLGNFLPQALPQRINPSATGSGKILRAKRTGIGWYVFGGFEARAVGRNMFLDGALFSSGHSVDKKTIVREISAGMALSYHRYALSYSYVHRSREFKRQPEGQGFGSINLSIAF